MELIPEFLKDAFNRHYGDNLARILAGLNMTRPVTLRVNTLKISSEQAKSALIKMGFKIKPVGFYADAFIIENAKESELQKTELYLRGEIYLQSLSSMLPPLLLEPKSGENILDMTAAPGGKTCEISVLSGGESLITACERDKIRFDRLKYNVQKQGVPRVNLLCTDALKLDDFLRFDKILLDAPCSGSGTLSPDVPVKISPKLVSNCVVLQKNLLKKALKLLKKGGMLVYSTCSILKEENENVLDAVLSQSGGELMPIDKNRFTCVPELDGIEGTVTVCPDELFEGFFLALIKKIK